MKKRYMLILNKKNQREMTWILLNCWGIRRSFLVFVFSQWIKNQWIFQKCDVKL